MKSVTIREYQIQDIDAMIHIWNEVVEEGTAFPQEVLLNAETGREFFQHQTYCGVACSDAGEVVGMYILHPNYIGRCSHIGNASYAVALPYRGQHIGEKLVLDSIDRAKASGFKIMQFNAVVARNDHARHLYARLGFQALGTIPNGFRLKNGEYEDICLYYLEIV